MFFDHLIFPLFESCIPGRYVHDNLRISTVVFTKAPSWGFLQFFPLVPMQSKVQSVSSLKHVMRSTTKKKKKTLSPAGLPNEGHMLSSLSAL